MSSAREAHTVFKAIGDRFGQTQSLAALGRSLVTSGRVDDGVAMLSEAYDQSMTSERVADDRFMLATALAGAAVAVGDPDVALVAIDRALSEVDQTSGISGTERIVAQALALVQVARPVEAVVALRPSAEGTADVPPAAYAQSALALALATVGEHDEVLALADEVTCGGRSTYLDRLTAGIAAGLVLTRDGNEDGLTRLSALVEAVDATDDEVAKAVARMAEAAALRGVRPLVRGRGLPRGRRPAPGARHQRLRLAHRHRPRARRRARQPSDTEITRCLGSRSWIRGRHRNRSTTRPASGCSIGCPSW